MNIVTYSETTASWENWQGRVFDAGANTLTIVTRDDITYVFDITTGDIVFDTVGNTPITPPAEDSWAYFVNDGALPLWAQVLNDDIGSFDDVPLNDYGEAGTNTPTEHRGTIDAAPFDYRVVSVEATGTSNVLLLWVIFLLIFIGFAVLQVFLSKMENKWAGLILPLFSIIVSIIVVLVLLLNLVVTTNGIASLTLTIVLAFMVCNIPTGIYLAIYAVCGRKRKSKEAEPK
jgi:hypothetical protein